MSSRLTHAMNQGLLGHGYPSFLKSNVHYEVQMGSVAYGVSNDHSDMDIYGWCIPPRDYIFPHLRGEIEGFGTKGPRFNEFSQHHVMDHSSGTEYDFTIYNVVKYLHLVMMNNPNMLDSLFVPERCVLHITPLGTMIRDKRRHLLHRGAVEKMIAYARSQLSKADSKKQKSTNLIAIKEFEAKHNMDPALTLADVEEEIATRKSTGGKSKTFYQMELGYLEHYKMLFESLIKENKRLLGVKRFGYDPKFLYHVVRLVSQCEQILREGDLNLEAEHRRAMMKSVRNGEWNIEDVRKWYTEKEREMIELREKCDLPEKPDEPMVRQLLVDVLECHYGKFSQTELGNPDQLKVILREVSKIINPYLD